MGIGAPINDSAGKYERGTSNGVTRVVNRHRGHRARCDRSSAAESSRIATTPACRAEPLELPRFPESGVPARIAARGCRVERRGLSPQVAGPIHGRHTLRVAGAVRKRQPTWCPASALDGTAGRRLGGIGERTHRAARRQGRRQRVPARTRLPTAAAFAAGARQVSCTPDRARSAAPWSVRRNRTG